MVLWEAKFQPLHKDFYARVEIWPSNATPENHDSDIWKHRLMKAIFHIAAMPLPQEWEMPLWAALKGRSLGYGNGLELLPYEPWMLDARPMEETEVLADLLAGMQRARLCAKEILADPGIKDFGTMAKALISSSTQLLSLDRSFKLELEFLRQNGEAAVPKAVETSILAVLPSPTRASSLSQSHWGLQDLRESQLCRFCNHGSKAQLTCVLGVVANMGKGVCPDIKFASASDFHASVWKQLPYFMRREVEVMQGDTKVKKLLMARPALMVGFGGTRAKMESKQVIKLHELVIYQSFKFLLQPAEVLELSAWITACLNAMASDKNNTTCSSASSGTQKMTKGQKETASSVMSFFG